MMRRCRESFIVCRRPCRLWDRQ